jgi:hypothetical protein
VVITPEKGCQQVSLSLFSNSLCEGYHPLMIINTLLKSHHGLIAIAAALFVLVAVWPASAQSPTNPTMTSGYMDNEKEQLYAQFTDYKRNPNPEQQRHAYPTAKEYLRRWGGDNSAETKEVRQWVLQYERAMHQDALYAAYNSKDYGKTFTLARPMVKEDPEYFLALALMTEAGYDNSVAGNHNLDTETAEYARQAIALLEAGKVSKADPFKSMEVARGFLNYALGSIVKDDKPAEAAIAFRKAVKSADSPYHRDPLAYHRLGIAIYKGELTQLSGEYNQKFGAKQASAEQTQMLNRILHLAEQAIDAYARAVALSDKPAQQEARAKILAQLTGLYKSFHNNSDAGLNDLIAGVLSKPMPE